MVLRPQRILSLCSGAGGLDLGVHDADAWRRILAEHPDLAPAVESPIRRVADGLATGLDLSRTARLRLTGNGVVPAQAALAFRTLWGLLGYPESVGSMADAGHAERTDGCHAG